MANKQHVRILLDQGVRAWNAWRGEDVVVPDLSGSDLRGSDLRGSDLGRADLSEADLSGADLSGADLSHANLSGAKIQGINLDKAKLSFATLSELDLTSFCFRDFSLNDVNLSRANLSDVDFSGADLSAADLREADLSGVNFSQADLGSTNLKNAKIKGTNFFKAELTFAILSGHDLTEFNFCGSSFSNADLSNSNLSNMDLSHANLSEANLSGADLKGADLSGANLRGADLKSADLLGTNLTGADLNLADLTNINFKNTILTGTTVNTSHFFQANFKDTRVEWLKLDGERIDPFSLPIIVKRLNLDYVESQAIERSIEFAPEHKEAGVAILSYFSTYVADKYPDKLVRVNIRQDRLTVKMQIETEEGDEELVEGSLVEYGQVVSGELVPNQVLKDELAIMRLEHKLEIAKMELRLTTQVLESERSRNLNLEEKYDRLAQKINTGVTVKAERIGVFNAGSAREISNISNDIRVLNENGHRDVAGALERLHAAFQGATDLLPDEQAEALASVEEITRQAALPEDERQPPQKTETLLNRVSQVAGTAGGTVAAAQALKPVIEGALPAIRAYFGI